MGYDDLLRTVLSCGAAAAVHISRSEVVLSPDFRKICGSNQCGYYGRCWMCPPDIGPIRELMETLSGYPEAVLYQTVHKIEDSFDIEGMTAAARKHAHISARIQERLVPEGLDSLHLSCGGCHCCETCAKVTGEPCRFPKKALASLEGYGVDVYRTVKNTPLSYSAGENTVTYFGMVFFH